MKPDELNFESFCSYRWDQAVIQFNRGEVRTCCRTYPPVKIQDNDLSQHGLNVFLNHPLLLERRAEMLSGVFHSDCNECWALEKRGVGSFRKNSEATRTLKYVQKASTPHGKINCSLKKEDLVQSYNPKSLVLFLSNVCDLKCAYCYYGLSTSWANENIKFNEVDDRTSLDMNPKVPENFEAMFWSWFETTALSLDHIGFTGGEPTLAPKFHFFIDRILAFFNSNQKKNILFTINTNMNYHDNLKTKNLATFARLAESQFLEIDMSVDGLGIQGEYIRNGLKNDRWEENFLATLQLSSERLKVGVSPTINSLIGPSLPGLFKYLFEVQVSTKIPIYLKQNLVSKPARLSPYILRPEDMLCFEKSIDLLDFYASKLNDVGLALASRSWHEYKDFLNGIVKSIKNADVDSSFDFDRLDLINFLEANDRKRNTDYLSVFPDLANFFDHCKEIRLNANS